MNLNPNDLRDLVEYAKQAIFEEDELPECVTKIEAYLDGQLTWHENVLNNLDLPEALWWFIENIPGDHPDHSTLFFKLRERVRNHVKPFMLQAQNGDFIVVAARNEDEAVKVAEDNGFEECYLKEDTFIENLYEQYGGVAVLSTGD